MYNKKLMQFLSKLLSVFAVIFLVYFVVKAFMGIDDMLMFNKIDYFVMYILSGVAFFTALYLLGGVFDRYFGKK